VRFVLALGVSLALIAAGPAVGQLRAAVERAFPRQYTTILAVAAGIGIAVGVLWGLGRIRERRLLRYALIGAALAIGIAYSLVTLTGDPSVDAVERFHFLEYGLVTLLSMTGHRWGSEQRADAEERARSMPGDAAALRDTSIIVTWPKPLFWLAVAALLAALLWF
jgi:hypothetical protein